MMDRDLILEEVAVALEESVPSVKRQDADKYVKFMADQILRDVELVRGMKSNDPR